MAEHHFTVGNATVDNTTKKLIVNIYLEGTLKRTYTYLFKPTAAADYNVVPETPADEQSSKWYIVFALASAAIVGFFFEQKFEGWGIKIGMVVLTLYGFVMPILWAISLLYLVWVIYDMYLGRSQT